MIIPIISKVMLEGREAIDPNCITYDDIMTCVNERERFKELDQFLNIIEQVEEYDLGNIGSKYLICANNLNDAYLSVIAVYRTLCMKKEQTPGCIFIEQSDNFGFGNGPVMAFMLVSDPTEATNDDVNSCMIFIHNNEDEISLSVDDIINNRLEFHIVLYKDTIPKSSRVNGVTRRICIGSDEITPAEDILENYFFSMEYEYDAVRSEIAALAKKLQKCDEYALLAAAKQIISNHILNDPITHSLAPEDIKDIVLPAKQAVKKQEQCLVGLCSEREKLNNIINSLYFEKLRKEMGYASVRDGCNIVFAGPPGTAKTTLAREFAVRLADIGLIGNRENFRECVKSDYVGQYVGQTAAKVDELFRSMADKGGGVIFFDEIYGLAEDDATAFDREAVTCILQNMENYRENIFCIFAGYEDKMNRFVSCNPGLRSRISNTIRFGGYDDETLSRIFFSMIGSQNYKVSGDCEKILKDFFAKLRSIKGDQFGNGREVRNLIVNAKQQHIKGICFDKKPSRKLLTCIDAADIAKAAEDIISSELTDGHRLVSIGF